MRKWLGIAAVVALAVTLSAGPASAAFVASVSGSAALIAPPADSSPGALTGDSFSVWEESSGSIVSDLSLDFDGTPGSYKGNTDYSLLGTTLGAGSSYNATMIHLQPDSDGLSFKGVVNFTTKIIGIALFGTSLDASDIYGAPGTTYPTGTIAPVGLDNRGIDFRANDMFSVSLDGKSLDLHWTANSSSFDQVRVFTAAQVPEPASLAVWSLMGLVGGGSWYRRKRKVTA